MPKILSEHIKQYPSDYEKIEKSRFEKICVFGYKIKKNQKIQVDFFVLFDIYEKCIFSNLGL